MIRLIPTSEDLFFPINKKAAGVNCRAITEDAGNEIAGGMSGYTIGIMRFPCGSLGNLYDHVTDSVPTDRWALYPDLSYSSSIKEKISLNGAFNAQAVKSYCASNQIPVILVLSVDNDPVVQIAYIQDWLDAGVEVAGVELGNETYADNQRSVLNQDMSTFSTSCDTHISSIRSSFPWIKIGLPYTDEVEWEEFLIGRDYDANIEHNYPGVSSVFSERTDQFIDNFWGNIDHPSSKEIWATEWSVLDTEKFRYPQSISGILNVLHTVGSLAVNPVVQIACFHALFDPHFGIMDDNAQRMPVSTAWDGLHLLLGRCNSATIPTELGGVYTQYYKDGEAVFALIINLSMDAVQVIGFPDMIWSTETDTSGPLSGRSARVYKK